MSKVCKLGAMSALAALLLLASAPAWAGQSLTWQEVSHLTQVHKIKVADAEDHLVGVYEHRGVVLFPGGRQGAYVSQGRFDVYDREGGERKHDGYGKISFADGSTIIFKCRGKETFKEGSKLPWVSGQGAFITGTGLYKGIKGSLTYQGGYVTGLNDDDTGGDAVLTYQAEYTLQK